MVDARAPVERQCCVANFCSTRSAGLHHAAGLKCTAYYTPKEGGAEVGVALRCASASNKVDLRAKLVSDGSRVSGSWEERTFKASGTVTGQASPTQIKLAINGGGFSGAMAVTTTGKSQVISVSTEGLALKGVSVKLQRD